MDASELLIAMLDDKFRESYRPDLVPNVQIEGQPAVGLSRSNAGVEKDMEEKCFKNVVERCRYMAQIAKSTVMRNSFTAAADEIEMLRTAISETLDENGHLADGDNCTLIKLKRAIRLN